MMLPFILTAFGLATIDAATLPNKTATGLSGMSTSPKYSDGTISELTVSTKHGVYQGLKVNDGVRAWLGIRYAMPPVADGRFEIAKPLPVGTKQMSALNFGPSCIQNEKPVGLFKKLIPFTGVVESEDCLSLNIWAPTNDRHKNGKKAAVLVWLSASGESSGITNFTQWYGDQFVRTQDDIVVVSVNTRGSIFGYPLSPAIPPEKQNAGLADQRLAVEWIRDNIDKFGGDPKRIVLWGDSFAGGSVGIWHYAYPSDPIISGAIQASGQESLGISVLGPQKTLAEQAEAWHRVATAAGCAHDKTIGSNNKTIGGNVKDADKLQLQCMKKVDAMKLKEIISSDPGIGTFRPVRNGVQAFSPEEYLEKAKAGTFSKTPVLLGNNDKEAEAIFGGPNEMSDMLTLQGFTCPAARAAFYRSSKVPTHRYRYFGNYPNINRGRVGAAELFHLSMIFGTYDQNKSPVIDGKSLPTIASTPAEIATSKLMQNVWATFTRDPIHGLEQTFNWPTYRKDGNTLARFGFGNATEMSLVRGDTFDANCRL